MADWEFSESARRYRDKASGKFLSPTTARELRDDFLTRRQEAMRTLAEQISAKEITVQDWTEQVRVEMKQTWGVQYAYGRGGRQAMADTDYDRAADLVKGQLDYLDGFARDLADGKLTAPQISARSDLYVSAAVHGHERGRASAWGLELEQYPGDGQTECLVNCRCELEISETDSGADVYWRLGDADSCDDCSEMSKTWNPLSVASERSLTVAGRRNGHPADRLELRR